MPASAPAVFELGENAAVVLGRSSGAGLRVEIEPHLSRLHAQIRLEGRRLKVNRLPDTTNPIYHGGRPEDDFFLEEGDCFVIGKTVFRFSIEAAAPAAVEAPPGPDIRRTISPAELYSMDGASDRMRLLDLFELPELLRKKDRGDFYRHISGILRAAAGGSWSFVCSEAGDILAEDRAPEATSRPNLSGTLITKALEDSPQPTYYGWMKNSSLKVTVQAGVTWVICAAAKIPGEPSLVFYVAGADDGAHAPRPEMARFVGLVADIVGRSLSNDHLQEWHGRLRRFFAPPVIEKVLASPDLKALEPRLAQSTVLFFDIRGSSKRSEAKNEEILNYVRELRKAMTAMTEIIMEERGVVLQYMGDGILACWNVPIDEREHIDLACRAARRMVESLGGVTGGWKCGVGVHTGEVVAGAIGSDQVFAYSVLGPVVNQASRIEGITKIIGAPILITKEVASMMTPSAGLTRRAGRFQPTGMSSPLELYELCAPDTDSGRLKAYESALIDFEEGRWEKAHGALIELSRRDEPSAYLRLYMEGAGLLPPPEWVGTIVLEQK